MSWRLSTRSRCSLRAPAGASVLAILVASALLAACGSSQPAAPTSALATQATNGAVPPASPPGGTSSSVPATAGPTPATASPEPAPSLPPVPAWYPSADAARIAARISTDGLHAHLEALDRIARRNGGTRATGSTGDAATVDYVAGVLAEAGYTPTFQRLDVPVYIDPGGNQLAVLGPGGRTFEDGRDFRALIYSAAGTVEGPVVAVGWDPDATSPGGPSCTAADFAGIPRGAIVLVGPGNCWRLYTVLAAQEAGAAAVVAASPWSGPGEVRRVTLIQPAEIHIPAMAASREVGEALAAAAAAGRSVRLVTTGRTESREVRTVLAELPGTDPDRVVIVGSHLDSSMEGPGMVDDGTGVATLLELARGAAGERPAATIRFAFWAAEEIGLYGSIAYITSPSRDTQEDIVAYLNADMLGSPNGIRGVYQEAAAARGSDAISAAFAADLEANDLAWEPVDLGGGADNEPFTRIGVPTGGLFSGATGVLTPAQAQRYGGQAGRPLDPCYHLACDGLANVDETRLTELAGSFARIALGLAFASDS